jgi:glycosyltransferase involved in cell wall biosynthesis
MLSTESEVKSERGGQEKASSSCPLVSVLVVVRNGAGDIPGVLDSIREQDYRPLEVLIVDGMSDDGTRALVEQQATGDPEFSIRLLDNPGRIQATGWNVGIRAARGKYVLRIDAVHCRLQPSYIHCCLEKLLALQQGDPSVAATGGRRLSVDRAQTAWSTAIAAAQCSRFGVGGAAYRMDTEAGFKDTLGVPLYDRNILFQVGLFDESLGRSEDNYLHAQMRWQGYKLYFIPDVVAVYHPRTTLSGLASQMFHNGWWVSATILRKRSFPFGTRHLVPFAFYLTLALLAGFSLAGFFPARILLGALLTLYFCVSLVAAFQASPSGGFWRVAVIFWLMHFCYAAGTAAGMFAGRGEGAATGTITAPGAHSGS